MRFGAANHIVLDIHGLLLLHNSEVLHGDNVEAMESIIDGAPCLVLLG